MVKEKDIYTCIEENKAPYIRIYNMQNDLLHIYDDDSNVQSTITHLQTVLPLFKGYGKVVVNCANESQKNNRWAKSYYITLVFDAVPGVAVGAPQQMNPWQMPPGYIPNEVMMAKLAAIEAANKHALDMFKMELKMKEMTNDKDDPAKQIEKFFPYALYAMGKSIDEIQKVTTAIRIGNANLGAASTGAPTNSLTFKDIQAKPSEEKQKIFHDLAASIGPKVSIEEMIQLYTEIDKDPSLVQTAIQALPLLKKS